MRLVIADKEQQLLMVLQSYLEDFGHRVAITDNAIRCLECLRTNSPQALILGTLLVGESESVLAAMEEEEALRQIPVILLDDPLCRINPSSFQVIKRMTRPIKVGMLEKFLASLQESQLRGINVVHSCPEQNHAKLLRHSTESQQDPHEASRTPSAG